MATFRQILIWVIVIGVLGALLFPIFAQPRLPDHDRTNFNYARVAASLLIYASEADNCFPPATSGASLRVILKPYLLNNEVFESTKKTGTPRFNFNLAGVNVLTPSDAYDVVLTYARNPQKRDEFYVHYLAEKRGTLTASQLLTALEPQFDRKGVKLFPPDYLADQDPLKEKNEK